MHKQHHAPSRVMVLGVGAILLGIVALTGYALYRQSKTVVDMVIANDIEMLHNIFLSIDKDCEITSIMHDRSYVDFLAIKEFAGNQVGALQLRRAEKWQGPYVEKNPTVQGKMYELVKVKSGYVIVPGTGVTLANGKVMGKDIVLNDSTDIEPYLTPSAGLEFKGRLLAARLPLRSVQDTPPDVIMSEAGA